MSQDQLTPKLIRANNLIKQAAKILLVTHYNPDGDGLSCLCAMSDYLKVLGKDHTAYCHNQPPVTYNFLPHIETVRYREPLNGQSQTVAASPDLDFESYDLLIVFDCGSLSRTKLDQEFLSRRQNQLVIEFDHHPRIDDYADLEIRDDQAAATAELLYYFFKVNRLPISRPIANCLLTGLITDTANFLYPSTSAQTIQAGAELVRLGAQLPRLTEQTLRNKSLEAMKLWGKIMAGLEINQRYQLAVTVLPEADFLAYNIDREELEGVSGFLSNLYGVKAILFLREEGDGLIRGSLRSADPAVDVSKLARLLGGGGHAKASGFVLKGKLVKAEHGWRVE